MNEVIIQNEQVLLSEIRKSLPKNTLPAIRISEKRAPELFDLFLTATIDDREYTFATECKIRPTAKDVDRLATFDQPRPLLATVRLTESIVARCKQKNVNCLDLNGRIWIHEPGLLIDRYEPLPPASYCLAQSEIQFFSPKSTRLPRTLLHSPDRTWRQSDLAKATGLSQGLLSRLLNHAGRQGWVEGKRGDWKLANLDALLDAWVREDNFSKRVTLRQYSTLEPERRALASLLVDRTHGELAFTQWYAASLRFPYADVPVVTAYRRDFPTDDEQRVLNYREVDDGGKIWIAIPRDDGVFRNIQRVEGLPLVSDAQIYLDLIHAGLRGPDQAKALREWKGFCKS